MSVSHGFHATLTAKPGMGDELVQYLLDLFDSEVRSNEDCVVFLVAR